MRWKLVRYRTKAERADENSRLVEAVFRELAKDAPTGTHYLVLRVAEDTFVHIVALEEGGIAPTAFAAFKAFQHGMSDRCAEQPSFSDAEVVGNYRMLGETLALSEEVK